MMLQFIPLGNLVDVLLINFALAAGGTPITDAQLSVNVLDSNRDVVLGPISMAGELNSATSVNNNYRGTFDASTLVEHCHYIVQVAGTNYTVEWEQEFSCERRPFTV